ncbi:MAG: histidine kinase [Holophagaceae bacterium]
MPIPAEPAPAWRWPAIRLRWAAVAAAFFLLNALRLAATVALDLRASGSRTPWTEPLVWELTSAFIVWALLPLAQTVALNAPWKRVAWPRFLAFHLAGAALFWTIHVAWMWGSRTVIYRLLGWGAYDYGAIAFRAPMEGLKDLLGFAALAALFHAVEARRERQARELVAAKLEAELKEARLQALSSQLDPHFLFNALNTLSAVMYEDLPRADRLFADLGAMLRDGLAAESPTWTLDRELAHLAHYLAFVEARFGDRVAVDLRIEAGLGSLEVPRFALQRLVENALKHNADAVGRALRVTVEARREAGAVRLAVTDDGAGFAPGGSNGVGLENLRRSLELLHDARARLEAGNAPEGGAVVAMILPGTSRG